MKNDDLTKHLQFFVAWQMAGLPSLHRPDKSLDDVIEEMYNKYMTADGYKQIIGSFVLQMTATGTKMFYTAPDPPENSSHATLAAILDNLPGEEESQPLVKNLLYTIYATYLFTQVHPNIDVSRCPVSEYPIASQLRRVNLLKYSQKENKDGIYTFRCRCGSEKLYHRFDATRDIPSQTNIIVRAGHVKRLATLDCGEDDSITTCYAFMNFICPNCGRFWDDENELLTDHVLVYKAEE